MVANKISLFVSLLTILVLLGSSTALDLDPKPLKMAAFNVRILGQTKMSKPQVVDALVKIILRYDIILIQEVRDSSDTTLQQLLLEVNNQTTNGLYDMEVSIRLGRTTSKEQYAFFYRKDVVSVTNTYVYDDGDETLGTDTFEREPFIVRFSSPNTKIQDFACVAIHTSPLKAVAEIDALTAVYDDVVAKWNLPDVIILGDFNAACDYVRDDDWKNISLATDQRFHWLIPECIDTTVGGGMCAYDRFVIAGDSLKEAVVPGSANIFKYDDEFAQTEDEALEVSDHYPIEMELKDKVWEAIEQHVTIERKAIIKDDRMVGFSSTRLYQVGKDSSNPLLSQEGFTLTKLYKSTGGTLYIINEKTLSSEDEVVMAVGTIRTHHPDLVTLEQVKATRHSVQSLVPSPTRYYFPYQTLDALAQYQYKVEFVCEMIDKSCYVTVSVL